LKNKNKKKGCSETRVEKMQQQQQPEKTISFSSHPHTTS
jgi:hypothetical protein